MAGPETSGTAGPGTAEAADPRFTNREMNVLELVAKGLTNVQIASELQISKYTVAQHVAKMLQQIGATNRTELVSRSYLAGILRNHPGPYAEQIIPGNVP